MKYFQVTAILSNIVETIPVSTTSAKFAKQYVEQYWRINQGANNRIVKVEEISWEEWFKLVYDSQN